MSDDDPMAGRTTVFHYFILPHNRRIKMIRRPLIRHSIDVSGVVPTCLHDMVAYRQGPFDHLCASEKHKKQKGQSCGDGNHTHQPDVPMEEQK